MDDNALKALQTRLDDLDRRLQSIEQGEEDRSGGWMAKIKSLSIIVGCVGGIIGGVFTLYSAYREVFAEMDIELVTGGPLEVRLEPNADRVSFVYGIVLNNKGKAPGAVRASHTHLVLPAVKASQQLTPIILENVHFFEKNVNNDVPIPFSIEANQPRAMKVSAQLPRTPDLGNLFANRGLYSLVLRLEATARKYKICYCFLVTNITANQFKKMRFVTFSEPDAHCSSTST